MGTKNNPGEYDCYENAEPDEPMFVLLGRDPIAPFVVRLWARLRAALRGHSPKVDEAEACARSMAKWAIDRGEVKGVNDSRHLYERIVRESPYQGPAAQYMPRDRQSRIGYLVEECGEVMHAAGKMIRWGPDSFNPELPEDERETNRAWLLRELSNLEAAIAFVREDLGD